MAAARFNVIAGFCFISLALLLTVAAVSDWIDIPSINKGLKEPGRSLLRNPADIQVWDQFVNSHSPVVEDYIKTLLINDPIFYDPFTDDEILHLFQPPVVQTIEVPFYIWLDHPGVAQFPENCKVTPENRDKGPNFMSGERLWYESLARSKWRVRDKKEAVLFFVPLMPNAQKRGWCKEIDWQLMSQGFDAILSSSEWRQYNGTNFVVSNAAYMFAVAKYRTEKSWLKENKDHDELATFYSGAAISSNVMDISFSGCHVTGSYVPIKKFHNLTYWPEGILETYKYPGGIWRQVQEQRPFGTIFLGQADTRQNYGSRRLAVNMLQDFASPNIMLVYNGKSCSRTPFRSCSENELRGCCYLGKDLPWTFEDLVGQARTGLHMRGDDWSSARLADLVGSQTLPIIIMKQTYTMSLWNQCFVPWDKIAIFVDHEAFMQDPKKAIKPVTQLLNNATEMERRYRLFEYYRKLLIWKADSDFYKQVFHQIVLDCIPEAFLREKGRSKVDFSCPFGDATSRSNFIPYDDEDYAIPWEHGGILYGPFVNSLNASHPNSTNPFTKRKRTAMGEV